MDLFSDTPLLLQLLAGMIIGYAVVSTCESFFHRRIQHAGPRLRRAYRKLGRLGEGIIKAWHMHHVVHHYLTFRRDHVTQFSSRAEQERLDARLNAKGHTTARSRSYGSRIGPKLKYHLDYMMPTLPVFATVCWLGGGWFTLGALVPLVVWPMLAQFIHPYLHMSTQRIDQIAPPFIRWFSRTRYFRFLAVHHWIHHRYEHWNYNLLLGGDWLLGVVRTPSPADLTEIARLGMWTPSPSQRN